MHRFTYDEVKMDVRRREEGLRRAQRNGTAFEYRPRRRIAFAWPWRKQTAAVPAETPAASRPFGSGQGGKATGLS